MKAVHHSFQSRRHFFLAVVCTLLASFSSLLAHTPVLTSAFPNGIERGSKPTLHLHGNHLSKAQSILFYREGITAGKANIHDDKHVSFPLIIDVGCPVGEHPIRLHCADGVTYQRTLWVSPFPIADETKEANDSLEQAQQLEFNSCVRGVSKNEDVDYYKVDLAAGKRFSVELFAMRLGRIFFDAHLSLIDPSGHLIATSDDTALTKQDPYISIVTKVAGSFTIAVREASYEGSDKSRYLLSVGDFLRPAIVFPPAAKENEATEFTFINDDGTKHSQNIIAKESFVFAKNDSSITAISPIPIVLSSLPLGTEQEPNNSVKQALVASSFPCAFHGVIQEDKDVDWYKFSAKKGQDIRIEVFARQLGSPLDARIILRDPQGKHLATNDDDKHPDSKLDIKIPADGEYQLNIRDHLGKGGPRFTYRIAVTQRIPSIKATLDRVDRNDSQKYKVINVPRGSQLAYKLNISRDRHSLSVTPHAESLPDGVKLRPIVADKGLTNIPLYFEASVNAPLAAGLYPLTVRSEDGKLSAPITETIEHVFINNQGIYHSSQSEKLTICVTEKAPFSIQLTSPTTPAVNNGNIQLEVKVTREEGFDKDITLFFPWLPPGISAPGEKKIPKEKNSVFYNLTINGECKSRIWDLCISGKSDSKTGKVHLSSNLIQLEIKPPYLTGKLELAATTQGQATHIICKLDHHTSFTGKAALTVHGLPDGITAETMQITSQSKEVLIPVAVNQDARTGKHGNLFCHIRVPEGKQHIGHNTGHGGSLRVDTPQKNAPKVVTADKPKTTATTKPLSRLEQLRLERKQQEKTPASN